MELLVLGGTSFAGRHVVERALALGHAVTTFNRGRTNPGLFSTVRSLHGDRTDGDYDAPKGAGPFDAVVDMCAYVPRAVRETAAALGPDGLRGSYILISSVSVYAEPKSEVQVESEGWSGFAEDSTLAVLPEGTDPAAEAVTGETYGPLKVLTEEAARAEFDDRVMVIRPGLIVGPHDPTDRFTYWVRRAAAGGEMLASGPPDASIQGIDARDLGTYVLDRIEVSDTDTYGVVGPGEPATMADVLASARSAGHADTTFVWADQGWVLGLGDRETWFPMWHPHVPGFHAYDAKKATTAGLRPRPFD